MMGRSSWLLLIALMGCYLETPTYEAADLGSDGAPSSVGPAAEGGPVGNEEGGTTPGEDGGSTVVVLEDGQVVVVPAPDGGGMDGSVPFDASVRSDGATQPPLDTGPTVPACMCTASNPVCIQATGTCVQCNAGNLAACVGDKPVCDLASSTCVACNADGDCPSAGKAKCNVATHTCVACDAKAQCAHVAGDLKVCNAGACVQCAAADVAACTVASAKPVCNAAASSCVACNVNQDCTDPSKPTCEANVCRACRSEADCTGKTGGGATLDACYNGQCVDCRINAADTKMDIGCTGNVACNPTTRGCTGKTKGSVGICQPCLADAECAADHRCIPMFYRTTAVNGYCMKIATPGTCTAPYTALPLTRSSLSGAASEDYCGITEGLTSCEAVRALHVEARTCPTGADAACSPRGGMCETVNRAANRCTYACTTAIECPTAAPCGGAEGAKYCGGT